MSAPVGSAKVTITGDLSGFAAATSADIQAALAAINGQVDSGLAQITQAYSDAGTTAATQFSDGLSAGADQVAQDATVYGEAGTVAGDEFSTNSTDALTSGLAASGGAIDAAYGQLGDTVGGSLITGATDAVQSGGDGMVAAGQAVGGAAGDAMIASTTDAVSAGSAALSTVGEVAGAAFGDSLDTTMAAIDVGGIVDRLGSDASSSGQATFDQAGQDSGSAFSDSLDASSSDAGQQFGDHVAEGSSGLPVVMGKIGSEAGAEGATKLGAEGLLGGEAFGTGVREGLAGLKGIVFASLGALGVGELIKVSVEAADSLELAQGRIERVFGESGKAAIDWADKMTGSLRESKAAIDDQLGTFGAFLSGLGIGKEQAAGLSEQLVSLAANMAAYHNTTVEATTSALESALKGRTMALKQYGVTLNATAPAEALMAHGFDLTAQKSASGVIALTAQQKAYGTLLAVLAQTKDEQHGLADTADTLKAKQESLSSSVSNLEAGLGKGLLPVLANVVGFMANDVLPGVQAVGHVFAGGAHEIAGLGSAAIHAIPGIQEVGHVLAESKQWVEPLALGLGVAATAYVALSVVQKAWAGIAGAAASVGKMLAGVFTGVGGATDALTASESANLAVAEARTEVIAASAAVTNGEAGAEERLTAALIAEADATRAATVAQTELDVALEANPIGATVAVVAGVAAGLYAAGKALGLFGDSEHAAVQPTEELTNAILKDNLAVGDNTKAWVIHKLEQQGSFDMANRMHISIGELTDAAMGNTDAMAKVTAATKNYGLAGAILHQNVGDVTKAIDANTTAAQNETAAKNEATGATKEATTAAQAASIADIQQAAALSQVNDTYGASLPVIQAVQKSINDKRASDAAGTLQMQLENDAAGLLAAGFDKLNGTTLSVEESNIAFKNSEDAITNAVKQNGVSLSDNTTKGRANVTTVLDAIKAAQSHAEAVGNQTKSVQQGTAAFNGDISALKAHLISLGYNSAAVQTLLDKYAKVPPLKITQVDVTGNAQAVLDGILSRMGAINGAQVVAKVQELTDIHHNALGTDDYEGGATWVGESGPEILNLPRHSQIIPNHRTAAFGQGGNDESVRLLRAISDKLDALDHLSPLSAAAVTALREAQGTTTMLQSLVNR